MFIHIALEDGLSAPLIVWVRIALGALALSLLARGALAELRSVRRGDRRCSALVQVAGPFLLITYGQRWIPSSLAAILVASAPIFVALIAPADEPTRRSSAAGRRSASSSASSASCCCSGRPLRRGQARARRGDGAAGEPRLRDRRDLGARATSSACRRSSRRRRDDDRRVDRDAAAGARRSRSLGGANLGHGRGAASCSASAGPASRSTSSSALIGEVGASRGVDRRLPRAGLRRHVRRDLPRRVDQRQHARRPRADPRGLLARGRGPAPMAAFDTRRDARAGRRGPAQPKWTFPFERART